MNKTQEKFNKKEEKSTFRRILPQIFASTAMNFLFVGFGMGVAIPTIVIPALTGLKNRDENEFLRFTDVQASWFASVSYISQPFGSLLSAVILEYLGHRKSMILVDILHIIGWLMLYFASSVVELFIAVVILGIGVGFIEAPILTYVGEITEPSIRGVMTSAALFSAGSGFTFLLFLGTQTTWRTASLICCSVPIVTAISCLFIPDSPYWLLSKNREKDAFKSLQWLRGAANEEIVIQEFSEMKFYNENANKCIPCQKKRVTICSHTESFREKAKEMLRKRTLKPFLLVLSFFTFYQLSGMHAMRSYLVQLFETFDSPIDSNWASVIFGIMATSANIVCTISVKFIGKRRLSLISMAFASLSCFALALYAFMVIPHEWSSFDKHMKGPSEQLEDGLTYIPFVLFLILSFATNVGIVPIPWMLISEVFPIKTRGLAGGLIVAFYTFISCITTKTYLDLERALAVWGTILFYGVIGAIGFVFIFLFIPETEKCTLEDIERHFSDNKRKLTDIKIQKNIKVDTNQNAMSEVHDNKAFEKN
ncbi:facilitated trehalose transporter Tret1-like [Culicoides brevitarsis]|uniref:facilitated trehalose transporter Tret1-like n=1 Tax=Culicoides brevitarsis TaxID=469753 RepID=UPI00307CA6A1